MEREIRILADGAAIAKRAAEEFVQAAASAVRTKGFFSVALAGGSTPKALYRLLVNDPALRSEVPWDNIHLFFGDERHVAPSHPDSNFRMATEAMISKSPLKAEQVTRIKGEYPDAEQAALEYEKAVREYFKLKNGEYPRFDLVLAGMGNEVEFEGLREGQDDEKDQDEFDDRRICRSSRSHGVRLTVLGAPHNLRCCAARSSSGDVAESFCAWLGGQRLRFSASTPYFEPPISAGSEESICLNMF